MAVAERIPYISKCKFMAGRQCLLRQWLQIHKPELDETGTTDIMEQGSAVGVFARTAFAGGVLVESDNFDFDKAVAETTRLMADPKVLVLFEAAFRYENLRVRVDMLARMGEGWSIGVIPNKEADYLACEVKASNSVKPHQIEDVSFQKYVLEKAGLDVRVVTVCHLNRDYVYPGGKIETSKLFKMEPVTPKSTEWVEAELAKQLPVVGQPVPPVIGTGSHCKTPYECEFYSHCNPKKALIGEPVLNPKGLARLKDLRFPLYILDFETITPAIPLYVGGKCWQAVPTQWSLHVLRKPNGVLEHYDFLHDSATDPRLPFAESVLAALGDMGDMGSVVMYSPYERSTMRRLAEQFPELTLRVKALESRWWDLYGDAIKLCYDKDDFSGSLSIKNVVQVLTPEVRYDELEVRGGDVAAGLWRRLITLPDGPEKDKIRRDLAAYCAVDTVAAYQVLRYLFGLLDTRFLETLPSAFS